MFYGSPLSDARHTAYGRVGGQLCRLHPIPNTGASDFSSSVIAEWLPDQPGADRERAESLGLIGRDIPPSGPMVDIDSIEQPFVNSEDEPSAPWPHFPPPAGYGEAHEPGAQPDVLAAFRDAVAEVAEPTWFGMGLECKALGTRLEVAGQVSTQRGSVHWVPPAEIVEWFRRLRRTAYSPDRGTWTTARFELSADRKITDSEFGYGEPAWDYVCPGPEQFREFYDELRYFPRDRAAAGSLLDRAWKYHRHLRDSRDAQPSRASGVRLAALFDGHDPEGKPVAYRPALPWTEKALVLDYLRGGRTVVEAAKYSADELDQERPSRVPNRFATDGVWVWPAAMEYYLDVHNVTPPHDLLAHIRGGVYKVPDVVADHAAREAEAVVMNTSVEAVDASRTAEALDIVLQHIVALRVSKRFYSFERPVEGGWSMLRDPDGWWSVFCTERGARMNESRFPGVYDAGAHLIGCLDLTKNQMRRPADEVLQDYECPMRPLPGEPGLDTYEGKLLTSLQPGDEVDRFGSPEGNTVFAAGTTLPQRSLPHHEQPGKYHRYRVTVAFEAISGAARPSHGQVGGGQAYVLPQAVGELVQRGWLTQL